MQVNVPRHTSPPPATSAAAASFSTPSGATGSSSSHASALTTPLPHRTPSHEARRKELTGKLPPRPHTFTLSHGEGWLPDSLTLTAALDGETTAILETALEGMTEDCFVPNDERTGGKVDRHEFEHDGKVFTLSLTYAYDADADADAGTILTCELYDAKGKALLQGGEERQKRQTSPLEPDAKRPRPRGGGSEDFLTRFQNQLIKQQKVTEEKFASNSSERNGFEEAFAAWKETQPQQQADDAQSWKTFMDEVKKHCIKDNSAGQVLGHSIFRIMLEGMDALLVRKKSQDDTLHCLTEEEQKQINSDVKIAWENTYEEKAEMLNPPNEGKKSLREALPSTEYKTCLVGKNFLDWASNPEVPLGQEPVAPFALPLLSLQGLEQARAHFATDPINKSYLGFLLDVLAQTCSGSILPYAKTLSEVRSYARVDTGSLRNAARAYERHEEYKVNYRNYLISISDQQKMNRTQENWFGTGKKFINWMSEQALKRAQQRQGGTSDVGRLSKVGQEAALDHWLKTTYPDPATETEKEERKKKQKYITSLKGHVRNHFFPFLLQEVAVPEGGGQAYVPLSEAEAASASTQP